MKYKFLVILNLSIVLINIGTNGTEQGNKANDTQDMISFTREDAKAMPTFVMVNANHSSTDEGILHKHTESEKKITVITMKVLELPEVSIDSLATTEESQQKLLSDRKVHIDGAMSDEDYYKSQINETSSYLIEDHNLTTVEPETFFPHTKSEEILSPSGISGNESSNEETRQNNSVLYNSSESFDLVSTALGQIASLNSFYRTPFSYQQRLLNSQFVHQNETSNEKPISDEALDIVDEITLQSSLPVQEKASTELSLEKPDINAPVKSSANMLDFFLKERPSKISKARLIGNNVRNVIQEDIPQHGVKAPNVYAFLDPTKKVTDTNNQNKQSSLRHDKTFIDAEGFHEWRKLPENHNVAVASNVLPDSADESLESKVISDQDSDEIQPCTEGVMTVTTILPITTTATAFIPTKVSVTETQTMTLTKIVKKTPPTVVITVVDTSTKIVNKIRKMHSTVFKTVSHVSTVYQSYVSVSYVRGRQTTKTIQITKTIQTTKTKCPQEYMEPIVNFFSDISQFSGEIYDFSPNFFNERQPSFHNKEPNFDDKKTSFDNKESSFYNKEPNFDDKEPRIYKKSSDVREIFRIDADGVPQNDKDLVIIWPKDFIIDEAMWN